MNKPNGSGLTRIYRATLCTLQGLRYAVKHESAFRQELLLCAVLLPLAFVITSDVVERVILINTLLLLLLVELINSAIEAAIDRIGTEHHPLSGRAKDLGSAAVFIAMLILGASWLGIFIKNWL